jgi:VIT1/CCC1 family predicted Fe2+/Mn2+ transporter
MLDKENTKMTQPTQTTAPPGSPPIDPRWWRTNWQREIEGAYLYGKLAEAARTPQVGKAMSQMSEDERQHAIIWGQRLKEAGVQAQPPTPDLRIHMVALLGRWFGAEAVLGLLINDEVSDIRAYMDQAQNSADLESYRQVIGDETTHARALESLRHPSQGDHAEPWHTNAGVGGWLREVVYGFNDGLTANFGLVMGVVGAAVHNNVILLAGFAGLLADALSMAASGFLASKSETEVSQHQLALERAELAVMPEEERQELIWHYRGKGLSSAEATTVADRLMENPDVALHELARDELGIDAAETPNALMEGVVTGIATGIGAVIPLIPFLFLTGAAAIWTAVAIAMVAHFLVGASRAIFTGRPAIRSGFEMFLVGMGVALFTYLLGLALGVRA